MINTQKKFSKKKYVKIIIRLTQQLLGDRSAMTMPEVLLALGLLSGLSVVMVTTTNHMTFSNKKYYQDFEKLSKMNEIDRALSDRASCQATLAGTPMGNSIFLPAGTTNTNLPSIIWILAATPRVVAMPGTTYGNNTTGKIILSSITIRRASSAPFVLTNINGTPGYTGNALIRFMLNSGAPGAGNLGVNSAYIDRIVSVTTDTSATSGNIKDCYTTVQNSYYDSFCKSVGGTYNETAAQCRSLVVEANGSPAINSNGNMNVMGSLTTTGNVVIGNTTIYATPAPDFITSRGNIIISNGNISTTPSNGNITAVGTISAQGDIKTGGTGGIYTSGGDIYAGGSGKIYTSGGYISAQGDIYTNGGNIYVITSTPAGNIYTSGSGNIYTNGTGNIISANKLTGKMVKIINTTNGQTCTMSSDNEGYINLSPIVGTVVEPTGYTTGRVATEDWVFNALVSNFPTPTKAAIINNIMTMYSAGASAGLNRIKDAVGTDIKNATYTNYANGSTCYMTRFYYDNADKYWLYCSPLSFPPTTCTSGTWLRVSGGIQSCVWLSPNL